MHTIGKTANALVQIVDFVVARILDQVAVPHSLMQRWGDQAESAS